MISDTDCRRCAEQDVEELNLQDTNSKLAIYQSLFAVSFDLNVRAPLHLPRHLHLNLSQRASMLAVSG